MTCRLTKGAPRCGAVVHTPKPSDGTRVYLIEPHPIAARYLETFLSRGRELRVESFVSLGPSVDVSLTSTPDVVIVDADELSFQLASYLHTLRIRFPDARILLIGKRSHDDDLCRALFQGVQGFVAYDNLEGELFEALAALMAGRVWAPPQVLDRYVNMSTALQKQWVQGQSRFTPRENEVIGLLKRRLSNKEIGCSLGISERTVRFHLENICAKLGVHDRYSVVDWAWESVCGHASSFSGPNAAWNHSGSE